jgi:hypothetical protein
MRSFIYGIFVVFFVASCSNNDQKPIEDLFTSYVQSNKKIVAFGSMSVKQILTKAEYKSISNFGVIIESVVSKFENSINLNKPIYYSIEGPLSDSTFANSFCFFAETQNSDSLRIKLKSIGYEVLSSKEYEYCDINVFGNNLRVVIHQSIIIGLLNQNKSNYNIKINEILLAMKNEYKEDKVRELIRTKSDLVSTVNLEKLYSTSNTDLDKLPKDKKDILQSLVKESYILNTVNFNAGELIIESKNYFSKALAQRMPLKQTPATNVLKNLGSGDPRFGLLLNMDFNRLKSLIADFGLQDELTNAANELVSSDTSSDDLLGAIFNGEFGAVVFEELMEEGGLTPSVNVLVGLGSQGKSQIDKLGIPGISLLQKEVFDSHALFYTSEKFKSSTGSIKVPEGCVNFGMKPISGFVYLNGMQMEDFDADEEYKFIEKIDYLYFEYGMDGGIVRLKAIDDKTNILKQAIDQAVRELSEMLFKMVF